MRYKDLRCPLNLWFCSISKKTKRKSNQWTCTLNVSHAYQRGCEWSGSAWISLKDSSTVNETASQSPPPPPPCQIPVFGWQVASIINVFTQLWVKNIFTVVFFFSPSTAVCCSHNSSVMQAFAEKTVFVSTVLDCMLSWCAMFSLFGFFFQSEQRIIKIYLKFLAVFSIQIAANQRDYSPAH